MTSLPLSPNFGTSFDPTFASWLRGFQLLSSGGSSHNVTLTLHKGLLLGDGTGAGPGGGDLGPGKVNVAVGYYINGNQFGAFDLADSVSPTNWAPTDQSGAGIGFTNVDARVVKFGNLVFAYGTLKYGATGSGANAVISLPVAVANHAYAESPGAAWTSAVGALNIILYPNKNTSTASILVPNGTVTNAQMSNAVLNFMAIYSAV